MIKILEHGFIAFFLVGLGWVFGGGRLVVFVLVWVVFWSWGWFGVFFDKRENQLKNWIHWSHLAWQNTIATSKYHGHITQDLPLEFTVSCIWDRVKPLLAAALEIRSHLYWTVIRQHLGGLTLHPLEVNRT